MHNKDFENGKPFKYVEDVNKEEFFKIHSAGQISWNEFENYVKNNT
ncbi:MAG: hypothetical protein ABJQ38_09645 [Flavobacteriaceae bacterium]